MFSCGGSVFDFAKGKEKKEGGKVGTRGFTDAGRAFNKFVIGIDLRSRCYTCVNSLSCPLCGRCLSLFSSFRMAIFALSQLLWGDAIEIVLEPALGLSGPSTLIYSLSLQNGAQAHLLEELITVAGLYDFWPAAATGGTIHWALGRFSVRRANLLRPVCSCTLFGLYGLCAVVMLGS